MTGFSKGRDIDVGPIGGFGKPASHCNGKVDPECVVFKDAGRCPIVVRHNDRKSRLCVDQRYRARANNEENRQPSEK
jgi:hypothetical protein